MEHNTKLSEENCILLKADKALKHRIRDATWKATRTVANADREHARAGTEKT